MSMIDFTALCLELGAHRAEAVPVEKIEFEPDLRQLCEQNACGRYARNYTCPPFVGESDKLIAKVQSFPSAVLWQNVYTLEDSFDFEGMMEGQRKHSAMTQEVARRAYAGLGRGNALVLGAGGCCLCESCAAITGEPCRYPEQAIASLEAHGINVSVIDKISGMKYINGANTVTYFSGVFWRQK